MAIKSKSQLTTDITTNYADNGSGNITPAIMRATLIDIVHSYEDIFQSYNTTGRDALTPTAGLIIYNTTTASFEAYNGSTWVNVSHKQNFTINCSGNPDYPAAVVGDMYLVSVAGKIGGSSGITVRKGDMVWCTAKNEGGNQATVGTSWQISFNVGNATNAFDDVYMVEIALTESQIESLHTTGVDTALTLGAGKIAMPIKVVTKLTYGTAAYNAVNLELWYAAGSVSLSTLINLNEGANKITMSTASSTTTGAYAENSQFRLKASGDAGTAGDGTVKVQIYYKVHTL